MKDLTNRTIHRYEIKEKIGQGGMSVVYRAFDTRLERDVAFKIIRQDAFSPEVLERVHQRFDREAKSVARLDHPNIVKVYDYGDHEGKPWLVMQFMSGGTVKQFCGKPVPYQQAAALLLPIANALEYAHNEGLLHRDVKPSNILLSKNNTPYLSDFGIAKVLDSEKENTITGTGVVIGTPEYISLEQAIGRDVDARTDVYSLGVVLYELITGIKPFTGETPIEVVLKKSQEPLKRAKIYVDSVPDEVEGLLSKALAKEKEDRYFSMAEFAEALLPVAEAGGVIPDYTGGQVAGSISKQWKSLEKTTISVPEESIKKNGKNGKINNGGFLGIFKKKNNKDEKNNISDAQGIEDLIKNEQNRQLHDGNHVAGNGVLPGYMTYHRDY